MRLRTSAVVGSLLLVTVTGCGAADMTKQASPFANAQGAKTVTLSVQSWVERRPTWPWPST
ncbi:Glycine/betaine ABC transporter substrate-binding protein OS=Streptomyces alboniger OX=132473 GN=CP975_21615 PE=4 SV=1 [Streptomyces alboniger]